MPHSTERIIIIIIIIIISLLLYILILIVLFASQPGRPGKRSDAQGILGFTG